MRKFVNLKTKEIIYVIEKDYISSIIMLLNKKGYKEMFSND